MQDKLRSVRGLVRRDGTWLLSRRFGPYGGMLDETSSISLGFLVRYQWTGREYDSETGFYYFRARYFDPAVRRFVQEDPIGYGGGGNLYAYADGDPTNGRDPLGLSQNYELTYYESVRHSCGPALYLDGAPVGCTGGMGGGGIMASLSGSNGVKVGNPLAFLQLTKLERDALYERYLANYEATKAELVDYYSRRGNQAWADALQNHSDPLGLRQFARALESLQILERDWPFGSVTMSPVAGIMGSLLLAGRVFVNSNLPLGSYRAASSPDLRVVIFRWDIAASSAAEMAFTFAHEYAHWVTGTTSDRAADAIACGFNPSYGGCR